MEKNYDIVVVGSINMDLFFEINRDPVIGETIHGEGFHLFQGGKGANQAIAAAKLEKNVAMIGCIGNDAFGKLALKNFEKYKVNHSKIRRVKQQTGVARVTIHKHKKSDNSIVVIPGANKSISKTMIDEASSIIKKAKMVLVQLEVPIDVVDYLVDKCYQNKIPIIINPAPFHKLKQGTIDKAAFIIPNEIEVRQMFPGQSIELACAQYPNKLIVTRGCMGSVFHNRLEFKMIDGLKKTPLDTTGAGDIFVAAFACSYIDSADVESSIEYANACAGISITRIGAQESSPTKTEITKYLSEKNQ